MDNGGYILYVFYTLIIISSNYIAILFIILDINNNFKTSDLFIIVINIIIVVILFSISKYGFLRVFFGNMENNKYIRKRIFILFISIIISMIYDYINYSYSLINKIKNIFFIIFLIATILSIKDMIVNAINDAKNEKKKF